MSLFQNIFKILKLFFEKLSFRTKPEEEIFYHSGSSHTEYDYEYEFMPLTTNLYQ